MIIIHSIGKVKQTYVKEGVQEFLKRLQKYSKVEYIESNNYNNLKGYLIALDVLGKELNSESFAQKINKLTIEEKDVTFIIGGPEGIPKEVLDKCQEKISLSKMTFPNELFRVIFLEQLYRAFTILKNEPYHKY